MFDVGKGFEQSFRPRCLISRGKLLFDSIELVHRIIALRKSAV